MNRVFAAVVALAAVAACQTAPSPDAAGQTFIWVCPDNTEFEVAFDASGTAKVFVRGRSYDLPGVPAGSGTRYSDGRVEYWERGGEAMLTGAPGGDLFQCTQR
ncbi:MAG: MliC family protein [Hyphomonadaceae bacterium]|nr:MliC family protein [Hyphomonadaceae bacterium]